MFRHSFIRFCLGERSRWLSNKLAVFFRIKDTLDEFRYKDQITCEEELKKFIFNELREKAQEAKTTKIAREIYSARGDWVLCKYPCHYKYPNILSSLNDDVEYDESLLLWHIATELCYFTSDDGDQNRELCKLLSDYMLYLLVMRPTLMSAVAGIAQIRFQDTCEEAKKFLHRCQSVKPTPERAKKFLQWWESEELTPKQAYKKLLEVKTVVKRDNVEKIVKPIEVKGDRSKSVLFDACILAKELKELDAPQRWEMSKIWVELLSYAASHCRPDVHARQLSFGGELITFVWLQMVHFGLGEQFRIEAGHARPKLLVDGRS